MVDKTILAKKLSAIRDAVARIREVLPDSVETFRTDRTVREIVMLNRAFATSTSTTLTGFERCLCDPAIVDHARALVE